MTAISGSIVHPCLLKLNDQFTFYFDLDFGGFDNNEDDGDGDGDNDNDNGNENDNYSDVVICIPARRGEQGQFALLIYGLLNYTQRG